MEYEIRIERCLDTVSENLLFRRGGRSRASRFGGVAEPGIPIGRAFAFDNLPGKQALGRSSIVEKVKVAEFAALNDSFEEAGGVLRAEEIENYARFVAGFNISQGAIPLFRHECADVGEFLRCARGPDAIKQRPGTWFGKEKDS